MASFNLRNNFSDFDVEKIVRLADIYADNFNIGKINVLPKQLMLPLAGQNCIA